MQQPPLNAIGTETFYAGLDSMMLPIHLSIEIRGHENKDKKLITKHRVLSNLLDLAERQHLPKYYAFETMRRLLKRKKWLYSYKHQIIELIWVLDETNDIRFKKHIEFLCKEIDYVKPL